MKQQCREYLFVLALLGLGGCGTYEPLEITSADNIPEGPGLFTGEEGQFEVEFD